MNQNPLNVDGYVYPQIGFFVDSIVNLEVGFASTNPDPSWVQGWLDLRWSSLDKFYGPEIVARIRSTLDAIYAGPDDGATWENSLSLMIDICASMALVREAELALL